jgi:hypothetical protein
VTYGDARGMLTTRYDSGAQTWIEFGLARWNWSLSPYVIGSYLSEYRLALCYGWLISALFSLLQSRE